MEKIMSNPSQGLADLVGFDPSKRQPLSSTMFKEAAEKFKNKRVEEAKVEAEKLVGEALTLQQEWSKEEKAFAGKKAKFEKTFGKLWNRIESGLEDAGAATATDTAGVEAVEG